MIHDVISVFLGQFAFLSLFITSGILLPYCILSLFHVPKEHASKLLIPLFGMGPICLVWIQELSIRLIPGLSTKYYLGILVLFLLILATVFRSRFRWALKEICDHLIYFGRNVRSGNWVEIFALTAILMVLGVNFYRAQFEPLVGNDELEYATVARTIQNNGSFENYPFRQPDDETGYFWPATHPTTFLNFHILGFSLQKDSNNVTAGRHLASLYLLSGLLALLFIPTTNDLTIRLFGGLSYATIPSLFNLAASLHIDPLYAYSFLLPFIVLMQCGLPKNIAAALFLGFVAAVPMTVHSAGVIVLPITLFTVGALGLRNQMGHTLRTMVLIAATAFLIAGWHYVQNYRLFGSPIGNAVLHSLENPIDHATLTAKDRGLDTLPKRFLIGVMRPWYQILEFGIIPIVSSWCFIRYRKRILGSLRNESIFIPIIVIAQLMGIFVIAALIGYIAPIQNQRYQLVLIPLMILLTLGLAKEEKKNSHSVNLIRHFPIFACLLLGFCFFKETLLGLKYGVRSDWVEMVDKRGSDVFRGIQWFKDHGDQEAGAILAFRPAEIGFYLPEYRIVCPDDPRLMSIYSESDPSVALKALREMDVAYVIVSFGKRNFYVNHSVFLKLLKDTRLVDEVFASGPYKIFHINDKD